MIERLERLSRFAVFSCKYGTTVYGIFFPVFAVFSCKYGLRCNNMRSMRSMRWGLFSLH